MEKPFPLLLRNDLSSRPKLNPSTSRFLPSFFVFKMQSCLLIISWFTFCSFWGPFWNPDFSILEALQVPLENCLEPLMLVLRAPKTRKVLFYHCKITCSANAAFRYFEALEDLLGRMLALLGPLWLQNGPRNGPRTCPTISKKWPENWSTFWLHF